MSIRFKFRSCQNFDSVDIDGRSSISLRELRLKIAHQKHLDTCQDFDLIFSDELSGEEYKDENFQIASGSSVIVKRVPARTMHSRVPARTMHSAAKFQCQKRDPSGLNQVIQRGSNHSKIPTKLPEPKTPDAPTLHKVISSDFPAVPNIDLPVELKCPLCNTVFKDAVMIPCCHHSFCEKCICLSLQENAMCPKCLCSRCRVEDLLPNLSLRKTIEHFLESQIDTSLSESDLRKYAPDGESGIQVKDISCAVTVVQREMEMPHSPSATGKGSNQVMAESLYDPYIRRKSLSRTMQQMDGGRDGSTNHWNFPSVPDYPEDCPGESKPLKLLHSHFQNEVDSSIKKNKGLWCDTRGGAMNFLPAGRVIKDRNCYMCGSPDHLIRDCAFASDPNPMLRTGRPFVCLIHFVCSVICEMFLLWPCLNQETPCFREDFQAIHHLIGIAIHTPH
ncbi:hypothetical protein BC332_21017 [Capsicum chinense]|nr:hypothetical protein BC332_21017 [Capsicum chinense]